MSFEFLVPVHVMILSDSQAALRAIRSLAHQSGQWLLKKITQGVNSLREKSGHTISLRWVLGHAKLSENERANLVAKAATEEGCKRTIF